MTKKANTRERLLTAAGKTFAEKGFRATTVRDICQRARANVAAVNYHFGNKQGLYKEVLSSIFGYFMSKYPPDLGQAEATTPEERLHAFVRAFLLRVLDPEQPAWHRRILAQEMGEPSPAMRSVIEQNIHRAYDLLHGILDEVLGGQRAGEKHLNLCIASVVGQCLFYMRGRHMIARMQRHISVTTEGIGDLAGHITRFSLGGVRNMEGGR